MPGTVHRGSKPEVSATWKEGSLFERDGTKPLLMKQRNGWSAGTSAATAWRVQGNTILKGGSSEPFCRIVQGQVLKGNSYDVLYRLSGDAITRGGGRDVVARGVGLTPEELVLAALVFDAA